MKIHQANYHRLDFYCIIECMGKIDITCLKCGEVFVDYSFKGRKYCSTACFYKTGLAHKGHTHSEETKKLMSVTQKNNNKIKATQFSEGHTLWDNPNVKKAWFKKGQKPSNWLGGKRNKYQKLKDDARWQKWRKALLTKYDNKCFDCGETKDLHAHHIKTALQHPELAYDIDNGVILCQSCHIKKHRKRK